MHENIAADLSVDVDSVNVEVQLIDLNKAPKNFKITKEMEARKAPWIQVHYPYDTRVSRPAWEAKLSEENLKKIVSSPTRKEIAKRIQLH